MTKFDVFPLICLEILRQITKVLIEVVAILAEN